MMTEINVSISSVEREARVSEDENSSSSSSDSPTEPSCSALVHVPDPPRLEILVPDFNLTAWNPMKGVDFLSLMRLPEHGQTDHVTKIKLAPGRRRVRREEINRRITAQAADRNEGKKLLRAAADNDTDTVESLLSRGVNPCTVDARNRTALHVAASKGNDKIVSILVKHGANPNQKDCIGNTPLHLAVCCNHLATVNILLEAGTDVLSLDHAGRTPLHLAQSRISVLQRELSQGTAADRVKDMVIEVADMMNRFLRVRGDESGVSQLTELCHQLQLSNTAQELSSVNTLLEQFTSLTLNKPPSSVT